MIRSTAICVLVLAWLVGGVSVSRSAEPKLPALLLPLGHTELVSSAAISGDGKLLVTGGMDKIAKLWDGETGKCIHTFHGHTGWIVSVSMSSDGKWVATA